MRGSAELAGGPPENLGLDFDAVNGAHHEHGQVGHRQGGQRFRHEIGITRGVEDVDLVPAPLERLQGERGRHMVRMLFGLEVRNGGPVLYLAGPVDRPTAQQQGLRESRLAGTAMADKSHIADLRRWVRFHASTSISPPTGHPVGHPLLGRARPVPLGYRVRQPVSA